MMRVGLVMERVEAWRGGAETSTAQFIDHLLALGVQVHLITRSPLPPRDGLAVYRLAPTHAFPRRAWMLLRFLREADRLARSLDVDLVHAITPCAAAHLYQPRSGTVVETIRRNVAMRTTSMGRGLKRLACHLNLRQRLMLGQERRLFARARPPHVAAVSEYVARQVREHYRLPGEHISVIPNGVDPIAMNGTVTQHAARLRRLYAVPDGDYVLLFVANNFKLKGLAAALETLAALLRESDTAATLLVVGRDNPLPFKRLAGRLGVSDRVRFVGHTEHIAAFYALADALLHPTYYDPCSRVVLEALSLGLPCVTTRFDGAAEAVDSAERGRVVDSPEDIAALADGLGQLLRSGLRDVTRTREQPRPARWSMRRHAEQVVALYERLIAGGVRR